MISLEFVEGVTFGAAMMVAIYCIGTLLWERSRNKR